MTEETPKRHRTKRIFSPIRFFSGILLIGFEVFIFFLFYFDGTAFDWEKVRSEILALVFFLIGFIISIRLIFAHTSYDDEKLVLWTLLGGTTIKYENVREIKRKWEGTGKSTRLRWYIVYWNSWQEREFSERLYFPENWKNKRVQDFFSMLKQANKNANIFLEW